MGSTNSCNKQSQCLTLEKNKGITFINDENTNKNNINNNNIQDNREEISFLNSDHSEKNDLIIPYNALNNYFFRTENIKKIQIAFRKYYYKKMQKNKISNKENSQISNSKNSSLNNTNTNDKKSISSNSPSNKISEEFSYEEISKNLKNPQSFLISKIQYERKETTLRYISQDDIHGYFLKKLEKGTNFKGEKDQITNKKNGFGIITWEDKSKLIGTFINNRINGICKFYNSETSSIFGGEYKNNVPEGYGYYKTSNSFFEGIWNRNNLIGIGSELWDDQTFYQGEFLNNKRNGIGLYRWPDGTIYQGEWKDNQMTGYACILYGDERTYNGQVLNGNMHGLGIFTWRNYNKYIGNYYKDLKNGFGVFIWSQKPLIAYVGFWDKGKQNGIGIKVKGGNVRYGVFKDGKKDFWLQGHWEMGKYLKPEQMKYEKLLSKNVIGLIKSLDLE